MHASDGPIKKSTKAKWWFYIWLKFIFLLRWFVCILFSLSFWRLFFEWLYISNIPVSYFFCFWDSVTYIHLYAVHVFINFFFLFIYQRKEINRKQENDLLQRRSSHFYWSSNFSKICSAKRRWFLCFIINNLGNDS
jgi:hypothetical protein